MSERLHRNSAVPNFDTYPDNPPGAQNAGNTALEQGARQVGSAVGRAVVTWRKAQERLKDIANQTTETTASTINQVKNKAQEAANRVGDITESVKNKAQQWSSAATARAEEISQTTVEKVTELGSQIRTGYYRARIRTNQVVRENPLQVVLIAGAVGFLIGVGLRIWRANHEY